MDRTKSIGASEVCKLFGIGGTEYDLYLEKTGQRAPWTGNEYTEAGKHFEPLIVDCWVRSELGDPDEVIYPIETMAHPRKKHMTATLDAILEHGKKRIPVEIKTTRNIENWKLRVPFRYYLQVQQQMNIARLNGFDVSLAVIVVMDTSKVKNYRLFDKYFFRKYLKEFGNMYSPMIRSFDIKYNHEIVYLIELMANRFWKKYIKEGQPYGNVPSQGTVEEKTSIAMAQNMDNDQGVHRPKCPW